MQPGPFSISLGDEEIACEMQVELEHVTLDEAIASGMFELPDEPGTVQIPVTVHVSIPNHLLWPTPKPPPVAEPDRAVGTGWGYVPTGGGSGRRFGNYPKAIAAENIARAIRSTLAFHGEHEAAAFRDLLAVMHGGSRSVASPAAALPVQDDAPSFEPALRTAEGIPVQLARSRQGPAEEGGDPKPEAASSALDALPFLSEAAADPGGNSYQLASNLWVNLPKSQVNINPRSATANNGTVTFTDADGSGFQQNGDHPDRDNNPLDLRYTSTSNSRGAIGVDKGFAIFSNDQAGIDAAVQRLGEIGGTLDSIIAVWSPPDENNTSYLQSVIPSNAGLSGNLVWSTLTVSQQQDFVHSYAQQEGFHR